MKLSLSLAVFLAFLFLPSPVLAHGFGQKFSLPLPFWMYLFASGVVVVVSFVLLSFFASTKKDIKPVKTWAALPGWFISLLRYLFLALFLLLLATGLFGNQLPGDNFSVIFFWILWTVGLFYLFSFLGNLWQYMNPWQSLFLGFKKLFPDYQPPLKLASKVALWPAVLFFVAYIWIQNVLIVFNPADMALLLGAYSLLTLSAAYLFGEEWFAKGEFFTVLYQTVSTFSPFKYQSKKTEVYTPAIRLTNELTRNFSLVVFILFMLAGVTFDGVKETPTYFGIRDYLASNFNFHVASRLFHTIALLLLFVGFFTAYYFFNFLVSRLTKLDLKKTGLYFVTSLVPIAVGYELAHFSSLLLIQGQDIIRVVGDPFAFGWNSLGTEGFRPILFVNAKFFWYFQIVSIIAGHIAGVYVAHKIALSYLGKRQAFISQFPMLFLMILFTIFSLWVISQPLVVQ
ncbi:MAG: hypothetical protein Q8P13_00710 [bacterium]|nr:hypothetical protein [bacterium]